MTTLARCLASAGHPVVVAVFYTGGALESELDGSSVRLVSLAKTSRWDNLRFIFRLIALLRAEKPDAVYSFLTVANLLNVLLKPLTPGSRRVWAHCTAGLDLSAYDTMFRLTDAVEARLARWADAIIANSRAGVTDALRRGYPKDRVKLVANGIDTARLRADPTARETLRAAWRVATDAPLMGLVGRLDPVKGHPLFLQAVAKALTQVPTARFVCVGAGQADYTRHLKQLAVQLGVTNAVIWAGERNDMVAVYSALDGLVSASSAEGLSNTLCEAMAFGLPCLATDVGDSARLLDGLGVLVPPNDPEALGAALVTLLTRIAAGDIDRTALRARIETDYSLATMVDATLAVLQGPVAA